MNIEEAIEIIRALLPKEVYVPYRTVMRRSGKGFTNDLIPLSFEEEVSQFQGWSLTIDDHVLTRSELNEYVATKRADRQAEYDRKHEAFRMLCEGE